jgi:hypothetical protein
VVAFEYEKIVDAWDGVLEKKKVFSEYVAPQLVNAVASPTRN